MLDQRRLVILIPLTIYPNRITNLGRLMSRPSRQLEAKIKRSQRSKVLKYSIVAMNGHSLESRVEFKEMAKNGTGTEGLNKMMTRLGNKANRKRRRRTTSIHLRSTTFNVVRLNARQALLETLFKCFRDETSQDISLADMWDKFRQICGRRHPNPSQL